MNARDTVDPDRPIAPGIASAAADEVSEKPGTIHSGDDALSTAPNVRPFLRFLTDRRILLISAPFSRGVMFVSQRHQTTEFGAASISN